jgi:hypothetical protein
MPEQTCYNIRSWLTTRKEGMAVKKKDMRDRNGTTQD